MTGPEIVTRGWVYAPEAEELLEDAKAAVRASIAEAADEGATDFDTLRRHCRSSLKFIEIARNAVPDHPGRDGGLTCWFALRHPWRRRERAAEGSFVARVRFGTEVVGWVRIGRRCVLPPPRVGYAFGVAPSVAPGGLVGSQRRTASILGRRCPVRRCRGDFDIFD